MKCLVVVAHPLADSLCHTLADSVLSALRAAGHDVLLENLYDREFDPVLNPAERASYYRPPFAGDAVREPAQRLLAAEALVLVFPTWWFSPPAILKGWFDRVWAPGIAYDHADDLGPIRPRLHHLRKTLVITSLGSPWWVDRLWLRQPVKRVLQRAILGTCAPAAEFTMLSLYRSERVSPARIDRFRSRIAAVLRRWD